MKKLTIVAFLFLITGSVQAQWTVFTPPNNGLPSGRDLVFDKPGHLAENFNRLGHLETGAYGSPTGKWAAIGVPNLNFPPSNNLYYGFMANWETDRAFFGIRRDGPNNANTIIAFGDNYVNDSSDGVPTGNRLIFQFDSWVATNSLEVATMRANGFFGLGVVNPTAQFHTTGTVRFQGLANGAGTSMLVANAAGDVFRQNLPPTGVTNNCANVNFVPKVANLTTLVCSQIRDINTGVGINVMPGMYVAGSSAFTAGNPVNGAVRLDVAGMTRSATMVITSDARFKENIAPVTSPVDSLLKLNGVQYEWTAEFAKKNGLSRTTQYGFIAQDVFKVLPNAVITDDKGFHSVNYNFFAPLLVEAIKEQQKDIAELREQVKKLQAAVEKLSNKL
jgi:Chaperone of endosialidase